MSILRPSFSKTAKERFPFILLIAGFFLVLFLLMRLSIFSFIFQPIQRIFNGIGTGVSRTYLALTTDDLSLSQERDYYRTLSAELALDRARISALEQENTELQTLLYYKESTPYTNTTARVLARSVAGDQTILIDKGSADGIKPHSAVIVEDGQIIGTILSVRERNSIVLLASNPRSKLPAVLLNDHELAGMVEGKDGFLLHMNFIPQDTVLEKNDVVLTSGIHERIPANLIIGIVDSVEENETAPFKKAFIRPLYDMQHLTYVMVLDPVPPEYD